MPDEWGKLFARWMGEGKGGNVSGKSSLVKKVKMF